MYTNNYNFSFQWYTRTASDTHGQPLVDKHKRMCKMIENLATRFSIEQCVLSVITSDINYNIVRTWFFTHRQVSLSLRCTSWSQLSLHDAVYLSAAWTHPSVRCETSQQCVSGVNTSHYHTRHCGRSNTNGEDRVNVHCTSYSVALNMYDWVQISLNGGKEIWQLMR